MSWSTLKSRYLALAEREQRALLILAIVVGLSTVIQIIWSSYETTITLRQELLVLEHKAAQARAIEKRVGELRAKPLIRQDEGEILLRRTLEIVQPRLPGLPATAVTLESARGISFDATVAFDSWLEFVAAVQRELALRLVFCEISQGDQAQVRVRARFALADPMP
jgi:hypothetical protein